MVTSLRDVNCVVLLMARRRWKLHLRPKSMPSVHINDCDIPLLPPSKMAVEILADFLRYLFQCAKTYIEQSHANGRDMWSSFEDNIDFVLSHPNGWEGPQQAQIRQAAVLAQLVPDTQEGQARIRLVTEGEASLHYCLGCRQAADGFQVCRLALYVMELNNFPGKCRCHDY